MAIEDATFVVQRGDAKFSCLGKDLGDKLDSSDLLIAQRGETQGSIVKDKIQDADLFVVTDGDNGHKSVTGAQVKELFKPPEPEVDSLIVGSEIIIVANQWDKYGYSWWNAASGYNPSLTGNNVYMYQSSLEYDEAKTKYATLQVLETAEMTNEGSDTIRRMPSKLLVVASPYGGFNATTNEFGIVRNGVIDPYSNMTSLTNTFPLYKP